MTLEDKKESVWKKGEKSQWDVKVKNLLYDISLFLFSEWRSTLSQEQPVNHFKNVFKALHIVGLLIICRCETKESWEIQLRMLRKETTKWSCMERIFRLMF